MKHRLLGEGIYAKVEETEFNGKRAACKTIKFLDNNGPEDLEVEASAMRLIECELLSKRGIHVSPRLYACHPDGATGGVLVMEAFDVDMRRWLSQDSPREIDIARCLFQVVLGSYLLQTIGISSNDMFTRNILIRRQVPQKRITRYKFDCGTAFMVDEGSWDFHCVISDFGLASGSGLSISHARRRSQFDTRKGPILTTHPLEQASIDESLLRHVDLLCLYVSLKNTRQCSGHSSRAKMSRLRTWCDLLKQCLDSDLSHRDVTIRLLNHRFISDAVAISSAIPDRIIRLY